MRKSWLKGAIHYWTLGWVLPLSFLREGWKGTQFDFGKSCKNVNETTFHVLGEGWDYLLPEKKYWRNILCFRNMKLFCVIFKGQMALILFWALLVLYFSQHFPVHSSDFFFPFPPVFAQCKQFLAVVTQTNIAENPFLGEESPCAFLNHFWEESIYLCMWEREAVAVNWSDIIYITPIDPLLD